MFPHETANLKVHLKVYISLTQVDKLHGCNLCIFHTFNALMWKG